MDPLLTVHALIICFFRIYFNIIFPATVMWEKLGLLMLNAVVRINTTEL